MKTKITEVITVNSEIMGGTPVFTGTRVPVQTLFDYIESGDNVNEFISDFPTVKRTQAIKVLEIAKKLLTQHVPHEDIA